MKHKITSITEKAPQLTTLPDGFYFGIWSGFVIKLTYKHKEYELTTEKGVKGIGIKVIVEMKDGIATFDTVQS